MSKQPIRTTDARPSSLWPAGTKVTMLDAWMKNPRDGKVVYLPNADHVVMEDGRGIRHFGHTSRIISEPPAINSDFNDLLGDTNEDENDFSDLLG